VSKKASRKAGKKTGKKAGETPAPPEVEVQATSVPQILVTEHEIDPAKPPADAVELQKLCERVFKVHVPREAIVEGHDAPLAYLCHTFFEAKDKSSADCVVWANRGGGKTFLGALASVLDMVFKEGIQIRILGGSLEQSQRMHEHVAKLLETPALAEMVDGKVTSKRISLLNGSRVEVLAASQRSVRGTRVQKIRCDEVDLFDPEVWSAAQLATRSMACDGPWGAKVRGSVEALSTMHRPYGLMWELVGARKLSGLGEQEKAATLTSSRRAIAMPGQRAVFRWGLLDVLEKCGPEHECEKCPLWGECRGKAKKIDPPPGGHVSVSDASVMKSRVDGLTWSAEMLCQRPRRTDAVYPEFEPETHVVFEDAGGEIEEGRSYIAGMDFGFRAEAVVLLASVDAAGVVRVEREHAASGMRVQQHIEILESWIEHGSAPGGIAWIGVDPAGRQKSDQTGESNVNLLKKAGFVVRARGSVIQDGLRNVRARLAPAAWAGLEAWEKVKKAGGEDGPRLLVHARCTRLIECLQRYHYPSDKPESMEPVKDGFDHACDALRYMMINIEGDGRAGSRTW
jgi:hypothetical protein